MPSLGFQTSRSKVSELLRFSGVSPVPAIFWPKNAFFWIGSTAHPGCQSTPGTTVHFDSFINQSINQSTNQPTNQPTNESTKQASNQSINQGLITGLSSTMMIP